ncbi:L-fucose kinase-like [Uloborus diversus]|uniref:L-fucose kinase-like n=1 Tax=Uloborus diversus TaxID=327109 RepID=UPI00240A27FD|nr:L-fucose kinase-like [Uloborus diversus]
MQAPLDSCTYLGLDSGVNPIQVSLFFDILVAMASNMTKESFIVGKCGKTYNLKAGINEGNSKENMSARLLVWSELSKYKMSPKLLKGHQHLYWSSQDVATNHMSNLFTISHSEKVHSINEAS